MMRVAGNSGEGGMLGVYSGFSTKSPEIDGAAIAEDQRLVWSAKKQDTHSSLRVLLIF